MYEGIDDEQFIQIQGYKRREAFLKDIRQLDQTLCPDQIRDEAQKEDKIQDKKEKT